MDIDRYHQTTFSYNGTPEGFFGVLNPDELTQIAPRLGYEDLDRAVLVARNQRDAAHDIGDTHEFTEYDRAHAKLFSLLVTDDYYGD